MQHNLLLFSRIGSSNFLIYILFLRKYIVINPRIICCENALVFKEQIKNKLLVEFKEKFLIKRILKNNQGLIFFYISYKLMYISYMYSH